MRILMAASEGVPFSKTGGLADVLGALPQALARLGHEVAVVLPRYRITKLDSPRVALRSLTIPVGPRVHFPVVLEAPGTSSVRAFFVEYPPFFDRDALYGTPAGGDYPDNPERFTLFSRVVLEIAKLAFDAQIIHCHDWQTALVPVLLATDYADDPALDDTGTLFTIHNLGYQGLFPAAVMGRIGLSADLFTMDRLEFWGQVNLLKGGLVYADSISAVSRKYAQEIQTVEYGFGLDGVIRQRAAVVTGILNGVNYGEWNPANDRFIAANYSVDNLDGKTECKRDLLREFSLSADDVERPLIGIVSRFTAQKGADLVAGAAADLAGENMCLVALGTGDAEYEDIFRKLARDYPQRIAVRVAYDNRLAHKIEAGADMFLMPSRYEPSGLNQMYSLKYGTAPIVRATGGLDDTVQQWNPRTRKGTGFKFDLYTPAALLAAVRKALTAYKDREAWRTLMRNGMALDFSWDVSAKDYVALYQKIVGMERAVAD